MPHIRRSLSVPHNQHKDDKSPIVLAAICAVAVLSFAVSPLAGATDDAHEADQTSAEVGQTATEGSSVASEPVGEVEDPSDATVSDSSAETTSEVDLPSQTEAEAVQQSQVHEEQLSASSNRAARTRIRKPEPPRTGKDPFSCEPGQVYALDTTGAIYKYDTASQTWNHGEWNKQAASLIPDKEGANYFNALGIQAGGNVAWAIDRKDREDTFDVYRFSAGSSPVGWEHVKSVDKGYNLLERIPDQRWQRLKQGMPFNGLIGGTVDPHGTYYFGGYLSSETWHKKGTPTGQESSGWGSPSRRVLVIFKADASGSVEVVGYVTGIETWNYQNGDFEIDSQGNLYVTNSGAEYKTSELEYQHITIPSKALSESVPYAKGVTIPRIKDKRVLVTEKRKVEKRIIGDGLAGDLIDGIAIDYDGNMFVGTPSRLSKIDPITGEFISNDEGKNWNSPVPIPYTETLSGVIWNWQGSTDLASCSIASTLVIKKNIVARKNPEDQFKLEVYENKKLEDETTDTGWNLDDLLATKTTIGDKTGDQSEAGVDATQLGPVFVSPGDHFRIREVLSDDQPVTTGYFPKLECEYYELTLEGQSSGPYKLPRYEEAKKLPYGQVDIIDNPGDKNNVTRTVCTFTNSTEEDEPQPFNVEAIKYLKVGDQLTPANGWSVTTKINGDSAVFVDEPNNPEVSKLTAGEGAKTGSASWKLNPAGTETGASVTVSETQQPGYKFDSGECKVNDSSDKAFQIGVNDSTGSPEATVTGIESSDKVVCKFVNAKSLGSLRWNKVDPEGNRLSGSEWKIVGPGSEGSTGSDSSEIKDCVSEGECQPSEAGALYDENPNPGQFQVSGLEWGTYTLTETKAPTGFVKDIEKTFTIGPESPAQLELDLKDLKNERQDVPSLPLTGGLGSHLFLIAGGVIGGAGLLAGLYAWRRRRVLIAGK